MNKILKTLFIVVVSLFMLDPTGSITNVKGIISIILITYTVLFYHFEINNKILKYFSLIFLVVLYGFIVSMVRGVDVDFKYLNSYIFSFFTLLMVLPLSKLKIDYIITVNARIGLIVSCIICIVFLLTFNNPYAINELYQWGNSHDGTLLVSKRSYYKFEYTTYYYRTIVFSLFSLMYYFKKRRYAVVGIILFSILLCGSRTPILASLSMVFYFIYQKKKSSRRFLKITFFLTILALGLYLLGDKEDISINVKTASLETYLSGMTDIKNLLFGTGLASSFFVKGHDAVLMNTELTYLDIIRNYGLFMGMFMIYLLFRPILYFNKLSTNYKDYIFVYFLCFVIAASNPFYFSSTGFYVLAFILVISHNKSIIKKNPNELHSLKSDLKGID